MVTANATDGFPTDYRPEPSRRGGVRQVGEVLEELLRTYEVRFPGIRVAVVETPAAPAFET